MTPDELAAWHEATLPIIQRVAQMHRYDSHGMTWCPMGCALIVCSGDGDEHADDCDIIKARRLLGIHVEVQE